MRIASQGQASRQYPQKMQSARSISKDTGVFSTLGSSDSPASMEMQTAGMHNQVRLWGSQGHLQQLHDRLHSEGFAIYLTADHGTSLLDHPGDS